MINEILGTNMYACRILATHLNRKVPRMLDTYSLFDRIASLVLNVVTGLDLVSAKTQSVKKVLLLLALMESWYKLLTYCDTYQFIITQTPMMFSIKLLSALQDKKLFFLTAKNWIWFTSIQKKMLSRIVFHSCNFSSCKIHSVRSNP